MKRPANLLIGALSLALFMLVSGPAAAQNLDRHLRPDHPQSYIVVRGDTLWDISARFLEKPWLWPDVWRNNPQIRDPHLIYPGDRIFLAWADGKPYLDLERGDAARSFRATPSAAMPGVTERLQPSVRESPLESPIPAIRLDSIGAFLVQNRMIEPERLDAAPQVLQGDSERLISGAGDRVYVRGVLPDDERLSVVRAGTMHVDPETGEVLGFEASFIGLGQAVSQDGDVATLRLDQVREEVRAGDRVLPTEERRLDVSFIPKAPATSVSGQIIAVFEGVSQVGPNDVVVVNRGSREGLVVGDTLAIHKRGAVVRDPTTREAVTLPNERAGLLMVFRTFEKLAYGVVLQADRPLAVADVIGNP